MHRRLLILSFALLASGALAGDLACGGNNVSPSGTAGHGGHGGGGGGGAGGASGSGGTGGDDGTGGTGGCAVGVGGMDAVGGTGGGTGGELTPQQINDALLNAPTTGGIDVTRAQPTSDYPACQ